MATYATWDSANKGAKVTLSGGDLVATETSASEGWGTVRSTIGVTSGKYYWEVTVTQVNASRGDQYGIVNDTVSDWSVSPGYNAGGWAKITFGGGDGKFHNNTQEAFDGNQTTGDVYGFYLDATAGTIGVTVNGVDKGIMYTGLSGTTFYAAFGSGSIGTGVATANFGATAFKYRPPTNQYYLGLGTDLPLASGIYLDTITSAATTGSAATLTFAHTCAAGTVLFVGVTQDNQAGDPSVAFDGSAMTKAISIVGSGNHSLWYLTTPTTGSSKNVVITFNGNSWGTGGAISFFSVNTSSPVGVTGSNAGTDSTVTTTVTSTVNNSVLLDTFYLNDRSKTSTVTSPQVFAWSADTGAGEGTRGEGSYKTIGTTGSYTMSWTLSGNSTWKQVVAEVKPAVTATATGNFFAFM